MISSISECMKGKGKYFIRVKNVKNKAMKQGNLFEWRDNEAPESRFDFPRVRKSDPMTSYESADNAENFADKHYEKILSALVVPMGKDAIARKTGLDKNQVSRRMPELQRLGKVELTGMKVKSDSGLPEREWQIKKNN